MVHKIKYLYEDCFKERLKVIYDTNEIDSSKFKGDVLYVGMGSRHLEKLHTSDVTSITYIEIDENIIATFGEGANIIKGDAFEVELDNKFDVIFLDIWEKSEKESELIRLENKFKNNLKEGGKFFHLKTVFAADVKRNAVSK